MFSSLKRKLKNSPLYPLLSRVRDLQKYHKWNKEGKPVPPPHIVKRKIVAEYATKNSCKTFYESGTYLGDMVNFAKNIFDEIYSVELSADLAELAKLKFQSSNNIHIIQGDSGIVIEGLLSKIKEPCLFWLDGHYSGGITICGKEHSPIINEVSAIIKNGLGENIILIDDARCFNGENGYPTLESLDELFKENDKSIDMVVQNDIIRILRVK